MTGTTLRGMEDSEAKKALASVIWQLTPHPGIGEEERFAVVPDVRDAVLGELRRWAKVDSQDKSAGATARILELAASELGKRALSANGAQRAKKRLGRRGDLSPREYQVVFGDRKDEFAKRSVRPSHIETAIASPDAVQHLLEEKFGDEQVSLFAKKLLWLEPTRRHVLLIETRRVDDVQHVSAAWRVFPEDVDLSKANEPLDILKAFVERFGLAFRVGLKAVQKFVLYSRVDIMSSTSGTPVIQVINPSNVPFDTSFHFKLGQSQIEVALAYAIATQDYCDALSRHGFDAKV